MKQFKLIKEYPGSPNVGEIATYREDIGDYVINNPYHQPLPKRSVENYPEFWKEITEPPLITTEDGFKIYEGDKVYRVRSMPNNTFYGIHPVRLNSPMVYYHGDKYFYKEKNADKYVEENEPRYSKKQIINLFEDYVKETGIIDDWDVVRRGMFHRKLKEL